MNALVMLLQSTFIETSRAAYELCLLITLYRILVQNKLTHYVNNHLPNPDYDATNVINGATPPISSFSHIFLELG